ncbi:UDP-N-acetylmuramoyl-L-alanyl-D-glutamate--2,6-diaminopimelate ligase [Rickettsia sp. MEAM1 (Bemisia tabaci)]|uniref:UDP-N-acetylmuramoyl-L-alanyl-D-glutamate--2, 6-diaminopimelate ligase n=1 Tax=unclassified Rickettsia TaxID=114295 RepID=UPI00083719A1|nr:MULTISPECIES: UDP-N-acetylmuramoyl-L-alanyl-D-glutamate--2,6-diaminopimelate ligase [unclassified Rickettsia]ASX27546.1 UDP-N-acetylmuramoyl-L-alanyl-D-glutamate--2,6-diaminopimelate ligase [Rickettsia sp. MEAM1 (Bemisia tabaci)]ODA38088.1 UDP-N-acetylmuramoyl-L-alanyl-D-glutamate--2,6-diaminopimelate ligase [Rickettsia sp. wq]ODA38278.1 UDP-N-acetylmuramoyl-L-alanyl-D-glutamate--2,6-diaminopimelate ligase [Rickettsia sp. wb]
MTPTLKKLFEKHNVKGLSNNSKTIKANDAFFAIKGGNDFIADALDKGAALVITDDKKNTTSKVIFVEDIKETLYEAVELFYPKKPSTMIAVTGTNGKSSVVSYIAQIYSLLGQKAASIGTIGVEVFGIDNFNESIGGLTTTDYLSFRKIAHKLAENGVNYLALEASSHGLDQQRLGDLKVNIACFTSFSQDHLDYHHTKKNYLLAKLKLFTDHLAKDGIAILNSDIEEIKFIKDYLDKHKIKYLCVGANDYCKITKTNSSLKGQNINFIFDNKNYDFDTPIIGSFQASNLLISGLSVYYTSFDFSKVISALTKVKAVKGRMERIEDANIFIDYAHTPDALEKALNELKNIKAKGGKLSVIFGCGGNRDTTKRNLMGKIAASIADNVIVTDDNPRHEDPKAIRQGIISGIETKNYIEIADRKEAIKYGINNLKKDDILLITGKGHENYQIIGDEKIEFDDAEVAGKVMSLR